MKLLYKVALAGLVITALYITMAAWVLSGEKVEMSDKFLTCFLGVLFIGFATGFVGMIIEQNED